MCYCVAGSSRADSRGGSRAKVGAMGGIHSTFGNNPGGIPTHSIPASTATQINLEFTPQFFCGPHPGLSDFDMENCPEALGSMGVTDEECLCAVKWQRICEYCGIGDHFSKDCKMKGADAGF